MHFRLLSAIYSDHDHLINADFCKEFFRLSKVDEYRSLVYNLSPMDVQKMPSNWLFKVLRKLLEQKGSKDWVALLYLAIWGFNDLPGPLTGFSPCMILFGRHPVGLWDCPPILPHTDFKGCCGISFTTCGCKGDDL